jgi:uncharacterized Tic20 family protein
VAEPEPKKEEDSVVEDKQDRMIHPRDRAIVTFVYLLAIVPLFGFLGVALIYMTYKERSRTVLFHAAQAMAGQAVLLLVCVVVFLFYLFARLVANVSGTLGNILLRFDNIVLWATFIVYFLWCAFYAWRASDGRDLDYPFIGGRLRDRAE